MSDFLLAEAAAQCTTGASAYLSSLVGGRYEWSGRATAEGMFAGYRASVAAPGVLTMVSDSVEFSSGAGGLRQAEISCDYDTRRGRVDHYRIQVIGP